MPCDVPLRLHGSPAGYLAGCRSRGGCAHHESTTYLTCAEAYVAAKGDRRLASLSATIPVPRDPAGLARLLQEAQRVHGSPYGYERGCRTRETCPNHSRGLTTCVEAHVAYRRDWLARRRAGQGRPIPHGTPAGYLAGCRIEADCPAPMGLTCAAARRAERRAERHSTPQYTFVVSDVTGLAKAIDAVTAGGKLSLREVARRSGIGRSTVIRIVRAGERGTAMRISERVLARIGAVLHDLEPR